MVRPTVVFVHGVFIWDPEWWWHLVAEQLLEHGIECRAVQLPSTGPVPPLGDLHDDAAAVRAVLDEIAGPIILVGHSYGGMVITEAAAGHPNVAHLVYIAAFVPDGTSALTSEFAYPHVIEAYEHELGGRDLFSRAANRVLTMRDGYFSQLTLKWMTGKGVWARATSAIVMGLARSGYATSTEGGSKTVMLNKLPDPQLISGSLGRLVRQSLSSGLQVPRGYAWKDKPSTFIVCLNDMDVPLESQREHAARCDHMIEVPTNHFAHLERPELLCGALVEVAERIERSTDARSGQAEVAG